MAEVIRRALRKRVRPNVSDADVRAGGRTVQFGGDEAGRAIDRAFATGLPYREARMCSSPPQRPGSARTAARRRGTAAPSPEEEAIRA